MGYLSQGLAYLVQAWAFVHPAVKAGMATISAALSGGTVPARDAMATTVALLVLGPTLIALTRGLVKGKS